MKLKDEHESTQKELNRRDFLKDMSLSVAGMGMLTGQLSCSRLCALVAKSDSGEQNMKYRRLGRTGLMVSEIGLGGHFSGTEWDSKWEQISDQAQKQREAVFREALKCGINFFDTNYEYERISLGMAMKHVPHSREKIYVETDINDRGKTAQETYDYLMKKIDEQLYKLQLPYVDILRFSTVKKKTPLEEVEAAIKAFKQIKKDGKAKFFAVAQHDPELLLEWINKFDEIEIIYTPYNYFAPKAEQALFPAARDKDIGVVVIKPFNKGSIFNPDLSKHMREERNSYFTKKAKVKEEKKERTIGDLTKNKNITLAQASLQYILSNQNVSIVIPGMDNVDQVRENVSIAGGSKFGMQERGILEQYVGCFENVLPENYQWLKEWKNA